MISAADLMLPEVQRAVMALKAGHTRPLAEDPRQLKFFLTPFFPVFLDFTPKECIMLRTRKRELQHAVVHRCSIRYRCERVRTNSARPATAGEAISWAPSRWFTASSLNSRPGSNTVATELRLKQ